MCCTKYSPKVYVYLCMCIYKYVLVNAALMKIWPSNKITCPSAVATAGQWRKSSSRTAAVCSSCHPPQAGHGCLEMLWVVFLFFGHICCHFLSRFLFCPTPCHHFVRTFLLPPVSSLKLGSVMTSGSSGVFCSSLRWLGEGLLH